VAATAAPRSLLYLDVFLLCFVVLFCLGLVTVHEDRADDQRAAQHKLPRHVEVEQVDGSDARDDDGQRCRKAFEDVVGVLDDHGDDQSAARLQDNQVPNEPVVAEGRTNEGVSLKPNSVH
jgi:hypothetical protein